MPTSTSRPGPAVLDLEQHPAAVRVARHFVQDQCHAAGINDETSETAVLLTSEVVTNAFLHGHSGAWVTLTASADSLRVEVGDDNSAQQPRLVHTDREALHGRGLAIVDTLAAAWGARGSRGGKVVWFELTRRGHASG
jgi:anti-sigma regulatory factor (Ser/Thr protein kinase)